MPLEEHVLESRGSKNIDKRERSKNIMGVNGAKTTPSALSSSMLPYLLGELLSKANEALVQPIRSVNTTQAEHRHYQRR